MPVCAKVESGSHDLEDATKAECKSDGESSTVDVETSPVTKTETGIGK